MSLRDILRDVYFFLLGLAMGFCLFLLFLWFKQTGCAYAGEPMPPPVPPGWYYVHEWTGNPAWCR